MPPSAWVSSPTMSTMRTTSSSGGSRLVAVRIRSGMGANASSRGSVLTSIARSAATSAAQACGDPVLEALRHLGQVEVHPRLERLHVAAGDQGAEVAEHHAGEQVQAGVGAHQGGTPGRPRRRRAPAYRPAGPGRPRPAPARGRRPCARRRCGSARRPTAARRGRAAGRRRRGRTPTGRARCASGEASRTVASHSRSVWSASSSRLVRPCALGRAIVTSRRRARAVGSPAAADLLQLRPDVGQVDARGDHADHVEQAQGRAVSRTTRC